MPLLAAALALTIHAAEADAAAAARAHFQEAERLAKEGRWREAIASFEAAYRAQPHPALFFNIGKCHEQLGEQQHAEALKNYREYLRQVPDAHDREVVVEAVRRLEHELEAAGRPVPPEPPALLAPAAPARPGLRAPAFASAGVGLVGLATGVALGFSAQVARAEMVSQVWPQETVQTLHDVALARATGANVAYAIAAAACAVALVLFLIDLRSPP